MKFLQLSFFGLLILAPIVGRAQVIPTVSATTNMGSLNPGSLSETLNGIGLIPNSGDSLHFATNPGNSWVSFPTVLTGLITFDLGSLYAVEDLVFWNQNAGGPGDFGSSGLRNVDIQTSVDGTTFTSLLIPTTFLQQTGNTSAPQTVDIDRNATHVRFNVLSNWGDPTYSGFAEVRFTGGLVNGVPNSVPDNGSLLAVFGATLVGLVGLRRRMNRS